MMTPWFGHRGQRRAMSSSGRSSIAGAISCAAAQLGSLSASSAVRANHPSEAVRCGMLGLPRGRLIHGVVRDANNARMWKR